MKTLENKVAVVTGAAMGNGYGIAEVFCKKGANVILLDIAESVFTAATDLKKKGYNVLGLQANVAEATSVKVAIETAVAKFGRLDILVNNAGIIRVVPFLEMTEEVRDLHWQVNINGVWNCTQAVLPYMVQQKYGKIVNISSVTGPMVADHGETAYATTKAAIWGFTKALAIEFAEYGVNVNAVCPGYVDTPMAAQIAKDSNPTNPDAVSKAIAAATPLKRLATIEEIGNVTAFLASDEASYITGTQIVIDGGSTLPETFGAVGI
ncbi:MAG TPA: SDR family oxidoreductase UcpA [Candidatus Avacidaminococcus intestinavium]|uniref:SDR family oxidoreductase UcpA n=1 Tax=Candidatus Avacidaminococcus intestinavium TaxID=2840684 RepID=A0A9D1MQ01_9FIRM|nr:SDR family oxidoreductase UcpA [Candidatus Avacidaminococcus intestinavium]